MPFAGEAGWMAAVSAEATPKARTLNAKLREDSRAGSPTLYVHWFKSLLVET